MMFVGIYRDRQTDRQTERAQTKQIEKKCSVASTCKT